MTAYSVSAPVVYRVWDKDDVLLYVGSTSDLEARRIYHSERALWRTQVALITSEPSDPDRKKRQAHERRVIAAEFPRWNIQWRSPNHPDGEAKFLSDVAKLYPENVTRPLKGLSTFEFDYRIQPVLDGYDPSDPDVYESYKKYAVRVYRGHVTPVAA